ncbi:MAG TPA: T9SS type A sorting domain-containing protein [Pelobium sp.]
MKKPLLLAILCGAAFNLFSQNFVQIGKITDSPQEQYTQQRGIGSSVAVSATDVLTGGNGGLLKQLVFGDPRVSPAYIAPFGSNPITQRVDRVRGDYIYSTGFGLSTAIDGDVAVVGEPYYFDDATPSVKTGAAVVFERSGGAWVKKQRLVGSIANNGSTGGESVAVQGNTIFVGEPKAFPSLGSVYVYQKDAGNVWQQTQIISPDNIPSSQPNTFGQKIAVTGDYLFVSSYVRTYVFKKDNLGVWNKIQVINPSLTPGNASFLYVHSLSADGNFLIVGNTDVSTDANNQNLISNTVGAAFIYENLNDVWTFKQKIVASDRAAYDNFGKSVAISGDKIVVGSQNDFDSKGNYNLDGAGAVYIFKRNSMTGIWAQTQKLVANDREGTAYFGGAVAIKGDNLVVGAAFASSDTKGVRNGNTQYFMGSTYLFKNVSTASLPESAQTVSLAMGTLSSLEVINETNEPILALGTSGAVPLTNNLTTVKVWKESGVPIHSGTLYLPRHYEITPTNNPNTSTAAVTLYFSQQEFLDFNSNSAKTADFPVNSTDFQGIANLRITKISGSSSDGSGLMATYTGSTTIINPDDDKIIWNASASRWEVSFNVTGFSGFFATVTPTVLPLTLANFTGKQTNNQNQLKWNTLAELNTSHFEVERSHDAKSAFIKIGAVKAHGIGTAYYTFTDKAVDFSSAFNYYRLKMLDLDGKFTYSEVVAIKNSFDESSAIKVYPNPVKNMVNIDVDYTLLNTNLEIFDINGRSVGTFKITNLNQVIELANLNVGLYILSFANGDRIKIAKE